MEEQFVTYEISLKLKELGFDEECVAVYFKNKFQLVKGFHINKVDLHVADEMDSTLAPILQQVIDWLRNEHDIVIEIVWQKYFDTYANSYAYEVACKVYKNKELEGSVVIRDNKNNHIFYSYGLLS